jgi:hypothetical protein
MGGYSLGKSYTVVWSCRCWTLKCSLFLLYCVLLSHTRIYEYSQKIFQLFVSLQLHDSVKLLFKKTNFGSRLIINLRRRSTEALGISTQTRFLDMLAIDLQYLKYFKWGDLQLVSLKHHY